MERDMLVLKLNLWIWSTYNRNDDRSSLNTVGKDVDVAIIRPSDIMSTGDNSFLQYTYKFFFLRRMENIK